MNKLRTIITVLFVLVVLAVNFSIVSSSSYSLCLNSLKQAFANNIEEVTITCNTGGSGRCYYAHPGPLVMCGEITAQTIACTWNGHTGSYCTPYNPCE